MACDRLKIPPRVAALAIIEAARSADEWDAADPDENTSHYLDRLDQEDDVPLRHVKT